MAQNQPTIESFASGGTESGSVTLKVVHMLQFELTGFEAQSFIRKIAPLNLFGFASGTNSSVFAATSYCAPMGQYGADMRCSADNKPTNASDAQARAFWEQHHGSILIVL